MKSIYLGIALACLTTPTFAQEDYPTRLQSYSDCRRDDVHGVCIRDLDRFIWDYQNAGQDEYLPYQLSLDHRVDRAEFQAGLNKERNTRYAPAKSTDDQLFRLLDINGDGFISLADDYKPDNMLIDEDQDAYQLSLKIRR